MTKKKWHSRNASVVPCLYHPTRAPCTFTHCFRWHIITATDLITHLLHGAAQLCKLSFGVLQTLETVFTYFSTGHPVVLSIILKW